MAWAAQSIVTLTTSEGANQMYILRLNKDNATCLLLNQENLRNSDEITFEK